jgi:hypothetical protein
MKKLFMGIALFAFTGIAFAQTDIEDEIQNNQDRMQQEPPRDTQRRTESAAKIDATKQQSEAEIDAEKEAKEKGQSKNYTKVNPDKISPQKIDSTRGVQPVKKPRN